MRGQRDKRAAEEAEAAGQAVDIIDVSDHQPRRIPSPKWRELIKKVWEADPLLCPKCAREMRIVALINEREVIERILRHPGLWEQGVRVVPARAPPELAERVIEPWLDDPIFVMRALFETGRNGPVSAPPEKRCLIRKLFFWFNKQKDIMAGN